MEVNQSVMAKLFFKNSRVKRFDIHLKELLSGGFIMFVSKSSGLLLGYLFTLIIARKFGAYSTGIFSLASTILFIISVFGRLGSDWALLRFVAEYASVKRMDLVKEVYAKTVRIVVPFCLFLSFLLFLSSSYISKSIFHKDYLSFDLKMVSLALLPFVMVYINSESLRGLKKFKEYAFIQNIGIYLVAAATLAFSILVTKNEHVPFFVFVVSVFLIYVISEMSWRKNSGIRGITGDRDSLSFKKIFDVSLPMMLSNLFSQIMLWTDIIVLGIYMTEQEVGIYSAAAKLAIMTAMPLQAVTGIAAPKFAEFNSTGDKTDLIKVIWYSSKLVFWTSFPIALLFFIFPTFFLGIFGNEFRAAGNVLLILTLGHFVNALSGTSGFVLLMAGKQKVLQHIVLIAAVMSICLNFILVPRYGLNGAACASMISVVFLSICCLLFVRLYFKVLPIYLPGLGRKM